jgi:LysR family transcriptional regulator, glycine cleavage system transcriptional activator
MLNLQKLPPLKALKGFEATARLMSLRAAADELNLTHAAISHQIKSLEADLGIKLFARQGRNIVLTKEGEIFYPIIYDALNKIISGAERVRRSASTNELRIQTFLTFSLKWLSYRLPKLSKLHPELNIHLISCVMDTEFDEMNADIGIIFCREEPHSHLYSLPIIKPKLFIVCSPGLIDSNNQNPSIEELLQHPLLSVYSEIWQWEDWFKSLDIAPTKPAHSIDVDTTAIALEMAMNGEGIALVNGPFADNDIKAGRLIIPIDHYADSFGYWRLVCRNDMLNDDRVTTFIDWIKSEVSPLS